MNNPLDGITKNILIIGTPKCGQNSLLQYLKKKYPDKDVQRLEVIWKPEVGFKHIEKEFQDYQLICIFRNNVDRIWSGYYYFGFYSMMTLEEYLTFEKPEELGGIGTANPLLQGDYDFWIKHYEKYDPIIVWLEDCEKLEGFPVENPTINSRKEYRLITPKERETIEVALNG